MNSLLRWRKEGTRFPTIRTNLSDFFDVENFFNDPFSSLWDGKGFTMVPATNIRETDKEFLIELAAPGMKKKDFHVGMVNGMLEIKVEKEEETKEEQTTFTRREYNFNTFCRAFTLPENVTPDKIKAEYMDGVLKVHLPKVPVATQKLIKEISVQ
jgi:HSP20 family protein